MCRYTRVSQSSVDTSDGLQLKFHPHSLKSSVVSKKRLRDARHSASVRATQQFVTSTLDESKTQALHDIIAKPIRDVDDRANDSSLSDDGDFQSTVRRLVRVVILEAEEYTNATGEAAGYRRCYGHTNQTGPVVCF